ncbi:diacylglycerol kinase family protein [Streptomyces sp. NPDC008150]|uniref:diacylglycerol kinase family protein n=1 Tax=Streptomyces sp. NPDC008150 TaxID=3364816 RepID=UPI0036E240A2
MATSDQLLVVIDPVARRTDGESVRIAKDVLGAGAATKVCLPEEPAEFARAVERRGSRRLVVVGDDRTLLRTVALLHHRRELAGCALGVVPVGGTLALARSLGVPCGAVAAARAVLDGAERRLDLLVDESDGVVLGALRIPPLNGVPEILPGGPAGRGGQGGPGGPAGARGVWGAAAGGPGNHPWLRTCQTLVRTLATRPPRVTVPQHGGPASARLRVEVDGRTLVDLDQPVTTVSVTPGHAGAAEVEVRPVSLDGEVNTLRALGGRVTVSGPDFRYRADAVVTGPVRTRTWTVREGAWGLTLPR